MNCPFCNNLCTKYINSLCSEGFVCYHESCKINDIPKYHAAFTSNEISKPKSIALENIIVGQYYVELNYRFNTTKISRLEACLLYGTILVPRVLKFDPNHQEEYLEKIKTILLFS
jgi:hypothetical protein